MLLYEPNAVLGKRSWSHFFYRCTHDLNRAILVRNRECNTERGLKNQLYIELGYNYLLPITQIFSLAFCPAYLAVGYFFFTGI